MKNLLFILTFLFVSTTAFGQKYFNNTGGGNLWSNTANWSGGSLPGGYAKVVIRSGNPIVDVAATCKMIMIGNTASLDATTTITATGGNTLTITGNSTSDGVIILNEHTTKALKFDLPVVYSGTANKIVKIYNSNAGSGTSANITFGSNSTFTYPDNKTMTFNVNSDGQGSKSVSFDGAISSQGQLILGTKSTINFGSTYDGSNQTGGILMNGENSTLTVNTTSGTFLKAGTSITTGTNSQYHKIIIADGAGDVFKGNIETQKNNITFTVNENQSAIGTITLGEGDLKLVAASDVTSIAFADSSGATWDADGKFTITDAADNEVSVGTSNTGLTESQLGKTTLNGSAVQISANGEIAALNVVSTTFESAGTDNLWSTEANWSTGTPTANTKVTLKSNLVVDSSQEIGQLKVSSAASGDIEVTATNSAILTINGNDVTQPIQNNNAGEKFTLNLPIVFSSTDTETVQVNGAGAGSITFGSSSELTLTATTKFVAKADRSINMDGTLSGAGQFQSGDASTIKFGSTSNNAGHSGGFKMLGGGSNIEVNTADNGTFLASGNTISNDSGTTGNTITVNTANVFKGNVEVTDEPMTLNIKANQTGAGVVTIGTGTLSLALDAAVTSLAFADSSAATWGAGALTITGVGVDEISFGTSNSAITADQLSKITVDGFSATINSSGKINSNFAPVAVDDTLTVAEDATLTSKDVIANDTDADANTLTLTAATTAGTGTIAINSDGLSVDYTPAANFNGTEVITYTVSDGERTDATGTLTVTVTAVADTPVAVANSLTVTEDAALTSTDVIANDTDGDGDTLSLTAATTAGTGTVAINADGLSVDYTPAANFNGTEVVTYTVSDGTDNTNGTFTVTVTAVNDAPVAVADTSEFEETSALTSIDVIANDTDVDGDTLSLTAATTAGTGTVAVNADGLSVDYTPAANFNGTEVITYTVSDGTLTDATGTLTVTVTAVNDAPVASSDSVTTIEDISLDVTLVGTDGDGDAITYALVDNPTNGTLSLTDNKATYVPNRGYFGTDSFTFKVNDGTVDSEKGTVSITVTSNDLDEDGILNDVDDCPNTPAGDIVDLKGCTVFTLPVNNNKVEVTSASCIGNADGSIGLSVEDNSFDYIITVTGKDDPIAITGENKTASVTGLSKGDYTLCFTVTGQADYEQCFEVTIGEPKALSAFIDVDNDNRTTTIQLGGSKNYYVDVNGERFKVTGDNFTTSLPTGLSIIKISTDLDCQGLIEREVFISEDIHFYPNPTPSDVNVHVGGEDTEINVSVFSEKGDLIYRREQQVKDMSRLTEIDLSLQITGTYLVVLESKTVRKTFKIVKK